MSVNNIHFTCSWLCEGTSALLFNTRWMKSCFVQM